MLEVSSTTMNLKLGFIFLKKKVISSNNKLQANSRNNKLQMDSIILASPKAGWGNCLPTQSLSIESER